MANSKMGIASVMGVCLIFLMLTGCVKLQGEFAFKKPDDDRYKRVKGIPEFNINSSIKWCYLLKKSYEKLSVGVVLIKKEIIWVDVISRVETINKSTKAIYGTIEKLNEGRYKLLVSESNEIVDEMEFIIYRDDEE